VEDVFFTVARDIKQRLAETDSKPEVWLALSWQLIWGALPVRSRLFATCVYCFARISQGSYFKAFLLFNYICLNRDDYLIR